MTPKLFQGVIRGEEIESFFQNSIEYHLQMLESAFVDFEGVWLQFDVPLWEK